MDAWMPSILVGGSPQLNTVPPVSSKAASNCARQLRPGMHPDLFDLLGRQVAERLAHLPLSEHVVPHPERAGAVLARRVLEEHLGPGRFSGAARPAGAQNTNHNSHGQQPADGRIRNPNPNAWLDFISGRTLPARLPRNQALWVAKIL